jgi:hypothetical protein
MAQASLTPGPGPVVRDALEYELLDVAVEDDAGSTGAAVEVDWPCDVQAVVDVGVMDAGVTQAEITIQGADNSAFDENVIDYGRFSDVGASDDGQVRQMKLDILKRFVRAVLVTAGTGTTTVTVTLRPPDWSWDNTSTA